jgi:hypothetical protein
MSTYVPLDFVDGTTPLNAETFDHLEAGIASAVAQDSVVVAGTRLVSTKLLTADAQPAFRILGSGHLEWGPGGGTALDVNLYRGGIDILKTDDHLYAGGSIRVLGSSGFISYDSTSGVLRAYNTGDAQPRLSLTSSVLSFGPGGSTSPDVNLYRSAADTLKTDDAFVAAAGLRAADDLAAGSFAFATRQPGDTVDRLQLRNDGSLGWGPGNAGVDVVLYRTTWGARAGLAFGGGGIGFLRLGNFTLATRPPTGGIAGALIYVSDAPAGQKFQGSDGATWVNLG